MYYSDIKWFAKRNVQLKIRCTILLQNAVADQSTGQTVTSTDSSTDEDEFFGRLVKSHVEAPHLQFLTDRNRDIGMLNSHPGVKRVFVRYNTTIASSAPVERLFSTAAQILTKRRNRLNDENFERLLLLKLNVDYWK